MHDGVIKQRKEFIHKQYLLDQNIKYKSKISNQYCYFSILWFLSNFTRVRFLTSMPKVGYCSQYRYKILRCLPQHFTPNHYKLIFKYVSDLTHQSENQPSAVVTAVVEDENALFKQKNMPNLLQKIARLRDIIQSSVVRQHFKNRIHHNLIRGSDGPNRFDQQC